MKLSGGRSGHGLQHEVLFLPAPKRPFAKNQSAGHGAARHEHTLALHCIIVIGYVDSCAPCE